jgi:hypothetical protein
VEIINCGRPISPAALDLAVKNNLIDFEFADDLPGEKGRSGSEYGHYAR